MNVTTTPTKKHSGSCHCGKVRFTVDLDASGGGSKCNCSICSKLAYAGKHVKPEAFALLAGEDDTSMYEWGGRIAQRYFCKHCGVHCFARGFLEQLGGAYVSVNLNAVDDVDPNALSYVHWDGRHDNWSAGPRPTPWPIFEGGTR